MRRIFSFFSEIKPISRSPFIYRIPPFAEFKEPKLEHSSSNLQLRLPKLKRALGALKLIVIFFVKSVSGFAPLHPTVIISLK
jgi:hypothetical protein